MHSSLASSLKFSEGCSFLCIWIPIVSGWQVLFNFNNGDVDLTLLVPAFPQVFEHGWCAVFEMFRYPFVYISNSAAYIILVALLTYDFIHCAPLFADVAIYRAVFVLAGLGDGFISKSLSHGMRLVWNADVEAFCLKIFLSL